MRRAIPVLVAVWLGLLAVSWSMTSQPFSGPDEAPHFVRALAIANGALVGGRDHDPERTLGFLPAAEEAWVAQSLRTTLVPAAMSPADMTCVNNRPDIAGSCLEGSGTGDYQPLPYLLPAAVLAVSHQAKTALYLARLVSVLPCALLIGLGLLLLWDGRIVSLLGPLAGASPMVLYVTSVLNPNGLLIAASFAFVGAVVRISRAPGQVPRWVWASAAVSGAVATAAWQLGPVFVVLDLLVGLALGRPAAARAVVRQTGARIVGLAIAVALAAYLAYGLAADSLHSAVHVHPISHGLRLGFGQLSPVLHDAVFRLLNVTLSRPEYVIWWALEVALAGVAIWLGTRGERIVMAVVFLAALAFPVVFFAFAYRFTGFGLQGRYVLPVLIDVPIVAGEIIRRHAGAGRLAAHRAVAVIGLIGVFQLVVWWTDARAQAGLANTLTSFSHAGWVPPGGWLVWCCAVALAVLALAGGLGAAVRGERAARMRPVRSAAG